MLSPAVATCHIFSWRCLLALSLGLPHHLVRSAIRRAVYLFRLEEGNAMVSAVAGNGQARDALPRDLGTPWSLAAFIEQVSDVRG